MRIFKKQILIYKDESGIETHQLTLESRYHKLLYVLLPLHYLIAKKHLHKYLHDRTVTSVHSNILFPCAITGYWLSKKLRCSHVITEHWSKIDKFFKVSLYGYWGRKALDTSFAITCVSRQLVNTVKKHTANPSLYVVPNVVDSEKFVYNPALHKNSIFTFIAVAHWTEPKNPFYFTEALELLHGEGSLREFKLVMVGTGPQLVSIKNRTWSFSITYIDALDPEDLSSELNKSHIFLHGSDYETFSVVIAEALLCGLPCVVSPVGIASEVINAGTGFVTDNTVSDWKDKILQCYHRSYDSADISKALAGRYDIRAVGELFEKIYAGIKR